MREIEFRAWDKDRHEWFHHGELQISLDGSICLDGILKDYRKTRFDFLQFTGLKDKNGRKIYEGDIVTISRYHPEEVLYLVTVQDIRRIPQEFYGSNFNWSEVEGNVYEHPELGHIPVPQPQNSTGEYAPTNKGMCAICKARQRTYLNVVRNLKTA